MESCPDCKIVKDKLQNNEKYELIDISKSVENLKRFITLRDNNPYFVKVKQQGSIGIPCIVNPSGKISFDINDLGFENKTNSFCSLDKKGC